MAGPVYRDTAREKVVNSPLPDVRRDVDPGSTDAKFLVEETSAKSLRPNGAGTPGPAGGDQVGGAGSFGSVAHTPHPPRLQKGRRAAHDGSALVPEVVCGVAVVVAAQTAEVVLVGFADRHLHGETAKDE